MLPSTSNTNKYLPDGALVPSADLKGEARPASREGEDGEGGEGGVGESSCGWWL